MAEAIEYIQMFAEYFATFIAEIKKFFASLGLNKPTEGETEPAA